MMAKKDAERLVEEKIRAKFMQFKSYIEETRKNWGCNPARGWIKIRLEMDEAAAFLGEKSVYGIEWVTVAESNGMKLKKAVLKGWDKNGKVNE